MKAVVVAILTLIASLGGLLLDGADCHAQTYSVASIGELTEVLAAARENDIILLEDGTYRLRKGWALQIGAAGVTLRGKSGNRDNVVVEGRGMDADGHHGFFVSAGGVTIADLTIQNVRNHCVQTAPGVDRLHLRNCILRNAGEQLLKVPTGREKNPSEHGLVEGCLFEYSAGVGRRSYIGGVDVHNGKQWIVRDSVFQSIRSPGGSIAEHAIHFWSDSADTLVEKNLIVNCDRGIGFGMGDKGHRGGVIRNNMITHDGGSGFHDVGIILESSPDTKVANNTIFLDHEYPNAIEARFPATTNVLIIGNTTNKAIALRNGATALIEGNKMTDRK